MVPRCRISGIVETKKHHPNQKKTEIEQGKNPGWCGYNDFFYYPAIWVFPIMVVPAFHTPKWSFLVGKPMGLLGKPTILGNTHINVWFI